MEGSTIMDHFVSVDVLPPEFHIPAEYEDRLQFDPESKRLIHHGFMSKTEYDLLVSTTSDWSFIRKLDDLFHKCTLDADSPQPQKGLRKLLTFWKVPQA